ncbi:unnamed protein product [Parnassius mnemosyne]|uniref:Transposable element P transposase-like RNase H C-terminal domain-containing protein n=1 Tax=Parnassius mnemosyne TaxID=213953 RepID=A0AAV1KYM2_9NEOP
MRPLYFNSDPIENFFGRVRSYNFRNNDPTCHTFVSTFKSLLITGLIKFHSETYNCEDETCYQLIKVQSLFRKSSEGINCNTSNIRQDVECTEENLFIENIQVQAARERLNVHSTAYTTGWVIKKILCRINCQECETSLCTKVDGDVHKWISQREYNAIKQRKLTYPSEYAVRHFNSIIKETNRYLEYCAHHENVSQEIKKLIKTKYLFEYNNCKSHKDIVLEYFLMLSIKLCIFNWCNIINRILKGTDIESKSVHYHQCKEKH